MTAYQPPAQKTIKAKVLVDCLIDGRPSKAGTVVELVTGDFMRLNERKFVKEHVEPIEQIKAIVTKKKK